MRFRTIFHTDLYLLLDKFVVHFSYNILTDTISKYKAIREIDKDTLLTIVCTISHIVVLISIPENHLPFTYKNGFHCNVILLCVRKTCMPLDCICKTRQNLYKTSDLMIINSKIYSQK